MSFRLVILTPQGLYLDKEIDELYVKTHLGVIGVLTGHIPLISPVEIASMHILIKGKKYYYAEFGGVLHVAKDKTTLIVNDIEAQKDIDQARALAAKDRAEKRLHEKDPSTDLLRAQAALSRALVRLETLSIDDSKNHK